MDVTIAVAILQIKRKELKITWAGLTKKWKVVLSQQKIFVCVVFFFLVVFFFFLNQFEAQSLVGV